VADPGSSPIAIYRDADACPVKAETYRVAARYGLKVHVVANAWLTVPDDPRIERVVVGGGFDAADDWIAARADASAIVVTADIPLAARCLAAGATVIGPGGRPFTRDSIGLALAHRAIAEDRRAVGERTAGPAPMSPRDHSRFLSALDEAVVRLHRRWGR
jgi:uncharacterized protein YaiI (UPF0178 family)